MPVTKHEIELREIIGELMDWDATMGWHEAPIWAEARKAHGASHDREEAGRREAERLTPTDRAAIISTARDLYANNEIQVDDDADAISEADGGDWVRAWVWVPGPEDDDEDYDPITRSCAHQSGLSRCAICDIEPQPETTP